MSDRRDPSDHLADALNLGLRRAQEAIERAAHRHADRLEKLARHTGEPWLADLARGDAGKLWTRQREAFIDRLTTPRRERKEARKLARTRARLENKLLKDQLQAERDALKLSRTTVGEGIVGVGAGLAMAGTALFHHELWWMVFPAFGIGSWGARVLSTKMANRSSPGALPAAVPAAEDPRDARVDAVCARITEELGRAAPTVRELVGKNEKVVEQLRLTCRGLTERERELRQLCNPIDDARLLHEREALVARIGAERDAVIIARLQSALQALDGQRQQRAELTIAAARFEAEHTRIAYTLEGLHTQLLRLRSADAASMDPASAALRQSLNQLGEEMDAVASAMDEVHRADLTPVGAVDSVPPGPRTRERG